MTVSHWTIFNLDFSVRPSTLTTCNKSTPTDLIWPWDEIHNGKFKIPEGAYLASMDLEFQQSCSTCSVVWCFYWLYTHCDLTLIPLRISLKVHIYLLPHLINQNTDHAPIPIWSSGI